MAEETVYIRASDEVYMFARAALELRGFTVAREFEASDGEARLTWIADRLTRQHELTPRERTVARLVIKGSTNTELAQHLEVTRATIKWHMHNIFTKTNTRNRESLLRLALQLGDPTHGDRRD